MRARLTTSALLVLFVASGCADLGLSQQQESRLQVVAAESPPAGEPAFHVVGLYRGLPPPWLKGDSCAALSDPECQMLIQHQVVHTVDVRVTDERHPVILGLSAYERTHWRIKTAPGAEIKRVILSGKHPQTLSGVGPGVPVEVYVEEGEPCPLEQCAETGPGFWDYQAPAERYRELVGQPPTSFLGAQEEGWIEIGPDRAGVQ